VPNKTVSESHHNSKETPQYICVL